MEAGQRRDVYCDIEVIAINELAHQAAALDLDKPLIAQGFLQAKHLKNARLVLHLQTLKPIH